MHGGLRERTDASAGEAESSTIVFAAQAAGTRSGGFGGCRQAGIKQFCGACRRARVGIEW